MALHVGGNLDNVLENRKALCHVLGTDLDHCVFAKQTHSDHIHCVTLDDLGTVSYTHLDVYKRQRLKSQTFLNRHHNIY